jgi:hypothetical protein
MQSVLGPEFLCLERVIWSSLVVTLNLYFVEWFKGLVFRLAPKESLDMLHERL